MVFGSHLLAGVEMMMMMGGLAWEPIVVGTTMRP